MNIWVFLAQQTMYFAIPLLIVAIGGMFSERSGVVNIALEGIMIFGAFGSIFFINLMQAHSGLNGQPLLLCAIVVAMVFGAALSFFHAYASVSMKADQTISGTALNTFAPAVAVFVARMAQPNGVQQVTFSNTFGISRVPVLSDIPIIGPMLFERAYLTTYIGIGILLLSAVVLYKTKFGLRLRACGEHPHAADSVGVNVYKMRYIGVLLSGALAGLGGLVFVVPTSTNFNATVAGYGFLAIAVLIFGQWRPARILLAAFFFGFMKTIAASYSGIPFLANLRIAGESIPREIWNMVPYIATLVVLAFTSKRSHAPRASGIPYDQGKR